MFDFVIAACLIAAIASLLRGRRYMHEKHGPGADGSPEAAADHEPEMAAEHGPGTGALPPRAARGRAGHPEASRTADLRR